MKLLFSYIFQLLKMYSVKTIKMQLWILTLQHVASPTKLFSMPGIVKVRILEGRDLPIMDRASELTDAYVDVKFHERTIFRTQVCSKTLCPKWNSGLWSYPRFQRESYYPLNFNEHGFYFSLKAYKNILLPHQIGSRLKWMMNKFKKTCCR